MATITVSLICRNEARHLPRWLKSVKPFADQIVAVDSGSGDDTVSILRQAGAEVVFHEFTGYSDQRNFAATLCTGDWIFCLDGDEFVDADLARDAEQTESRPRAKRSRFPGAWARYTSLAAFCGTAAFFPEKKLRLHKRGQSLAGPATRCTSAWRWWESISNLDRRVHRTLLLRQRDRLHVSRMEHYAEMSARHLHLDRQAPPTASRPGATPGGISSTATCCGPDFWTATKAFWPPRWNRSTPWPNIPACAR